MNFHVFKYQDAVGEVVRGLFPSLPPTVWDNIPLEVEEISVVMDLSDAVQLVPPFTVDEVRRRDLT